MRKSKRLIGAALGAALAAGCRHSPEPPVDPSPDVTLEAPAPSSATLTSPLRASSSAYTNEMQAENLRNQAADLGIRKFDKIDPDSDGDEERPTITAEEGLERTRAYAHALEARRHEIDRDKEKTVTLPNSVPGLLSNRREGAPFEPEPPSDSGPKDPQAK